MSSLSLSNCFSSCNIDYNHGNKANTNIPSSDESKSDPLFSSTQVMPSMGVLSDDVPPLFSEMPFPSFPSASQSRFVYDDSETELEDSDFEPLPLVPRPLRIKNPRLQLVIPREIVDIFFEKINTPDRAKGSPSPEGDLIFPSLPFRLRN